MLGSAWARRGLVRLYPALQPTHQLLSSTQGLKELTASTVERRHFQSMTTSGESDIRVSPKTQQSQGSPSTVSLSSDDGALLRRTSPTDSSRRAPVSTYDCDGEDADREPSFVVSSTEDIFLHDPSATPWFENSTCQLVFPGVATRRDDYQHDNDSGWSFKKESGSQHFSSKKHNYATRPAQTWRKLSDAAFSSRRQPKPSPPKVSCFSPSPVL